MTNDTSPPSADLSRGIPDDRAIADGADFVRRYWRSAPAASSQLMKLSSEAIDEATFRLLADNIPTLCWIANGDGYIVWYNRRWHEYCGTSAETDGGLGMAVGTRPPPAPRGPVSLDRLDRER